MLSARSDRHATSLIYDNEAKWAAAAFTDNAIGADHLSRRLDELRNPPADPP
jgi:hypothetical protein